LDRGGLAGWTENKYLSRRLAVEADSSPISKGSEDIMNDNQIETLSKAIDSLLDVRKRLGLVGRIPAGDDQQVYQRAVVHITNARYLMACLAQGEEWRP
jgi:hypothetical protein